MLYFKVETDELGEWHPGSWCEWVCITLLRRRIRVGIMNKVICEQVLQDGEWASRMPKGRNPQQRELEWDKLPVGRKQGCGVVDQGEWCWCLEMGVQWGSGSGSMLRLTEEPTSGVVFDWILGVEEEYPCKCSPRLTGELIGPLHLPIVTGWPET